MKKETVSFAVQSNNRGGIQKIGKSVIDQPKINFKGGSVQWFDDSLLVRYIYREEGEPVIKTKQAWLEWFEQNGDKENFEDAESWFLEMTRMQILCKVSKVGK